MSDCPAQGCPDEDDVGGFCTSSCRGVLQTIPYSAIDRTKERTRQSAAAEQVILLDSLLPLSSVCPLCFFFPDKPHTSTRAIVQVHVCIRVLCVESSTRPPPLRRHENEVPLKLQEQEGRRTRGEGQFTFARSLSPSESSVKFCYYETSGHQRWGGLS